MNVELLTEIGPGFVLPALVVAVVAYFCGCFNGAVIVSKYILRDDVRKHGSGNAGLTNFYRTFGGPLTLVVILTDVLKAIDYETLGLLAGLGMTLAVQSSAATIAVLQRAAARPGPDGGCLLGLAGAIPVLLGDNIGTTVTAVLASVGQSRDAKRLAAAHALFNLSGAAVCWLLLPQFTALVRLVSPHGPESAVLARQIANAHTLFNLGCTVLWLPLTPCMVRIVCILLPERHAP